MFSTVHLRAAPSGLTPMAWNKLTTMTRPSDIATRSAPSPTQPLRAPNLAIALSGGGYRAMLYHLGALKRLNEFGLLSVVDRISSVSGGSLIGAVLGLHWHSLKFDSRGVASGFDAVERDVMNIAGRTIDIPSGIWGFMPATTGAAQVAKRLDNVFDCARLADLPHDKPRFTFNSVNQVTGNLFRWSPSYGADYGLGRIDSPTLSLAAAVAASAAFPPLLSPLRIRVPGILVDHQTNKAISNPPDWLWLTDGGAYDNLGIETLKSFHTILASDGGAPFHESARLRTNALSQSLRTTFMINNHVGRQRRRRLVHELKTGQRLGALWTISTPIEKYDIRDVLPCPQERIQRLANIPTRLRKLPRKTQLHLINWGYASADAGVRKYVDPTLEPPTDFPHEDGVG